MNGNAESIAVIISLIAPCCFAITIAFIMLVIMGIEEWKYGRKG